MTYDLNISQSYKNFTTLVNPTDRDENPFTATSWTWDDITDLQVGVVASSPTKEVIVTEILMPNGDDDTPLAVELIYPASGDHYTKVDEYPYSTSDYIFKYCSIGYVDASTTTASTGDGKLGDLVVSDNDIIHVLTNKYLQAFSFDAATGTLAYLAGVNIGNQGYAKGTSISYISDGTDDYILVEHANDHYLTGYSFDTTTPAYVEEDTIDNPSGGNYQDSCSDDDYHYALTTNADSLCELQSISFPDGAGGITVEDREDIDIGGGYTYDQSVSCTTTGFIQTVHKESAGSGNYPINLHSWSVNAGTGALTHLDSDNSIATGYEYAGYRDLAAVDFGSAIMVVVNGSHNVEIYSIDNGTGAITHETTHARGTNEEKMQRVDAFMYDSKWYSYAACNDNGSQLYEWDTDNYDVTVVGKRENCTGLDSGYMQGAGHLVDSGKLYLFTNGDDLYAHTVWDYYDLYDFENSGGGLGTVVSLDVKFVTDNAAEDDCEYIAHIDSNGTMAEGSITYSGSNLSLQTVSFLTDPDTGVAWLEAGINAVIAGVEVFPEVDTNCANKKHRIIQMYLQVNHTKAVNPEIRVTQQNLVVGYTPTPSTCYLNKPDEISTNHARNVKMFNFWNGEREVYDLNRSGKSMVLTGSEQYGGSCDKIICVRNMARNGAIVTVSELNPNYFNGDYRITSFGWNKISEKPEHYKWILDLEAAD